MLKFNLIEYFVHCLLFCTLPLRWTLYYKTEDEKYFHEISLSYDKLKLFLEQYGYETNNIEKLKKFGINTDNMKLNKLL